MRRVGISRVYRVDIYIGIEKQAGARPLTLFSLRFENGMIQLNKMKKKPNLIQLRVNFMLRN